MPLSDSLTSLLGDIGSAIQKIPTSTVGGAVDIGNMILGGYANIADLVQGKPISRAPGEGLVKKPVGGTDQLNEFFGMGGSKGLVEDSAAAMLSVLNPASMIKSAMIVPAVLMKSGKTIKLAEAALAKGKPPAEVFQHTGIYHDPADGVLKSVMDDSQAKLKMPIPSIGGTLEDVLDHPELFRAMPDLGKTKVGGPSGLNIGTFGSYSAGEDKIRLAPRTDPEDLFSTLLHETQHAVQEKSGFATGGNPDMFFRDKRGFDSALDKAMSSAEVAYNKLDKAATSTPEQRLSATNATRIATVLQNAKDKSFANYTNIAGEVEARRVQDMRASGNYSTLPTDLHVGQTGRLISDPMMGNKVDNDPLVRAVMKYFND